MEHNPAAGAEDRGRILARPLWGRSLGAGGVEADLNLEEVKCMSDAGGGGDGKGGGGGSGDVCGGVDGGSGGGGEGGGDVSVGIEGGSLSALKDSMFKLFRLWAGYPPCPRTSGIYRQSEQSALESELFPQAWSIIRQQVQRIEVGFWRGLSGVAAWARAGSRLI